MEEPVRPPLETLIHIEFPTLGITVPSLYAELRSGDSAMQTAYVRFNPTLDFTHHMSQLITGLPVKINWSSRDTADSFYGYLVDVDGNDPTEFALRCAGVDFPLRRHTGRAMAGAVMQQALAVVCSDHRLSYTTYGTVVKELNLVQGDRSDWQWLKDLAVGHGLSYHMRGGTILALPLDTVVTRSAKGVVDVEVPLVGQMGATVRKEFHPVRKFSVSDAAYGSGRLVSSSTRVYTQTMNNSIASVLAGDGVEERRFDMAGNPQQLSTLDIAESRINRWRTRATLVITGLLKVNPLDVIRVTTPWNKTKTLWSVLSIKRTLSLEDNELELELGREFSDLVEDRLANLPPGVMKTAMWDGRSGADKWSSPLGLRLYQEPVPGRVSMTDNWSKYRWVSEA